MHALAITWVRGKPDVGMTADGGLITEGKTDQLVSPSDPPNAGIDTVVSADPRP